MQKLVCKTDDEQTVWWKKSWIFDVLAHGGTKPSSGHFCWVLELCFDSLSLEASDNKICWKRLGQSQRPNYHHQKDPPHVICVHLKQKLMFVQSEIADTEEQAVMKGMI